MRRFRFRLEAALKYRESIEQMRQQALAGVQSELADCSRRIDDFLAELRRTVSGKSDRSDLSDLALVQQREFYCGLLRSRLDRLHEERERILERLDAARVALVAASQARKAIQRVREKDYAEHVRAALAEEQALLDEVGGRVGVRRQA